MGFTTAGRAVSSVRTSRLVRCDGHRLPAGGAHLIGHQALGHILVHSDGGAEAVGAGVGHPQQVQSGLDASVLSAGPVESQIDHIRPGAQFQHPGTDERRAPVAAAGPHLLQGRGPEDSPF